MNELIEPVLLAASTPIPCSRCGDVEYVVPLDDCAEPLDGAFTDGYVCSDCEK